MLIFARADATGMVFTGSNLKKASFVRTNLKKADFREAKDYYFDLRENNVRGAKFLLHDASILFEAFGVEIE